MVRTRPGKAVLRRSAPQLIPPSIINGDLKAYPGIVTRVLFQVPDCLLQIRIQSGLISNDPDSDIILCAFGKAGLHVGPQQIHQRLHLCLRST